MLMALLLPSIGAVAQTALPYNESFDTKSDFDKFTVVDANGDGMTWTYDDMEREATCEHDGFMASADDWLISPMFHLEKGVEYTLSVDARNAQDGTTETFDIVLGNAPSVDAMTMTIMQQNSVEQTNPATTFTKTFSVDVDGDYYIGFHHNSEGGMFGNSLCLDNISLSAEQKTESSVPSPVSDVTFTYNHDTALATLKWKAPTTTVDGKPIDPQDITYTIRRVGEASPVATDFPGTTFRENLTIDMLPNGKVFFGEGLACYSIVAHTKGGDSEKAVSDLIIIGTPQQLPYAESFPDGKPSHFWAEDHDGVGRWNPLNHVTNTYVHDGDRGTYAFSGGDAGDKAVGMTGRIQLLEGQKPVLSFWYYPVGATDDKVTVEVSVDGGAFNEIATLPLLGDDVETKWHKVTLSLDDYNQGKPIQIALREQNATSTFKIFVDDLRIYDQKQHDLMVGVESLPANLRPDEERTIDVKVSNLGSEDVNDGEYTIRYMAKGSDIELGSTEGVAIKSGEEKSIKLTLNTSISLLRHESLINDSVPTYAYIDYAADETIDNNISDIYNLRILSSGYPCPNTLTAVEENGQVALAWDVPDAPRTNGEIVEEGFEEAPDFCIKNWGDWTLVDNNQTMVYGPDENFTNANVPQAFIVLNPEEAGLNSTWNAHTGKKELAAFSTAEVTDHWLISPELSGEKQNVTFYARPYSKNYIETFEVLYSKKSLNTEDFNLVQKYSTALNNNSWQQYSVEIPEDSKYFALHYTTINGFALLLDDFTFTSVNSGAQDIKLSGYNVYRDNVKLNDMPLSTTSFTDMPDAGRHVYTITAVYDKGESAYSNSAVVKVVTTGINAVAAEDTQKPQGAYDLNGRHATKWTHGVIIVGGKKIANK